jgi:hypothetical protein
LNDPKLDEGLRAKDAILDQNPKTTAINPFPSGTQRHRPSTRHKHNPNRPNGKWPDAHADSNPTKRHLGKFPQNSDITASRDGHNKQSGCFIGGGTLCRNVHHDITANYSDSSTARYNFDTGTSIEYRRRSRKGNNNEATAKGPENAEQTESGAKKAAAGNCEFLSRSDGCFSGV